MTTSITITWPELVKVASEGLASREPFDVATGDLLARGIVSMDAELHTILQERRRPLPASGQPAPLNEPAIERCITCGTAVTPGALIGNTLANGAMPKLAESALLSMRLYTDEIGALRKRVAELEALVEAAARADDAREHLDGSAKRRIAELEATLRTGYRLIDTDMAHAGEACDWMIAVERLLAGNSTGNSADDSHGTDG